MQLRNTTLDDLAAIIGFTATARLAAWFGRRNLYIPPQAQANSALASLVGMSAAKRLSREFPGQWLAIPNLSIALRETRYARICEMFGENKPVEEIAKSVDMGVRRIQQLRVEFELLGMIEPRKNASKNEG